MPASTPDPIGKQPELEVPAFHTPVELSLNAERSSINKPRQSSSSPSPANNSGQGALRQTADAVMHPNMNMAKGDGGGSPSALTNEDRHVMSWMSYDGDGSGPVR